MPIPGDLRALDALTRLEGRRIGFEAETQLFDCQAACRRALLKRRDADLDVIILVVADTVSNRRTLAQHRESFRGSFPLDSRAILSTLKRGEAPPADGILVL